MTNSTPPPNHYDYVGELIAFESEDIGVERTTRLFQYLIDSGYAWRLQGYYGRTANDLIEAGYCKRPEEKDVKQAGRKRGKRGAP